MNNAKRLAQLALLSQLVLDTRLIALRQAALTRQQSLDHLTALDRPQPETDLSPIVAGEVAMRYQLWADQRRSDINLTLARQTLTWTEARQDAARAFGRDQALNRLIGRH